MPAIAAVSLQPQSKATAAAGGGAKDSVTSQPQVSSMRVRTHVESPSSLTTREEEVETLHSESERERWQVEQ